MAPLFFCAESDSQARRLGLGARNGHDEIEIGVRCCKGRVSHKRRFARAGLSLARQMAQALLGWAHKRRSACATEGFWRLLAGLARGAFCPCSALNNRDYVALTEACSCAF